jgi:hypothetical protein
LEALAHEVIPTLGKTSILAFFLIVWFDTDAFFEYIKVFRLHKYGNWGTKTPDEIWGVPEYEELIKEDPDLSYIEFLNIKHNNFFTRLFSCPLCLGFWVHIFISLVLNSFTLFFVSLLLGCVVYFKFSKLLNK